MKRARPCIFPPSPSVAARAAVYAAKNWRRAGRRCGPGACCGNVSVLGERGEKRRPIAMLTAGAPAGEWLVLATGDVPSDPNSVPLPGSLALALLALAAVCATRRRADRLD